MKPKKIAIVYAESLKGVARAEKMRHKIINDLIEEGRVVRESNALLTLFTDGTRIDVFKMGALLIGRRVTHLYIDCGVFDLENGKQYVKEALAPFVVHGTGYKSVDAEGKGIERMFIFNSDEVKRLDEYKK